MILLNNLRDSGEDFTVIYSDLRKFGFCLDKPSDVSYWYNILKDYILRKRRQRSALTGLVIKGPIDAHHGIVLRSTVPKNIWWHPLIHSELNLFLLSREEHINPPSRQECWNLACNMYGIEVMEDWYFGLPWKTGYPPQYFN